MNGTCWSRARVAQVDSDDRVVVLRLAGITADTAPVALEGVARALWDMLAQPRTSGELLDGLGEMWPGHDLTETELAMFMDELVAAGVATASPPSGATGNS